MRSVSHTTFDIPAFDTKTMSLFNIMFHCDTFSPLGYSGTEFLATFDTNAVTPGDPIVFNYPVISTGGHYDPTTGIYTIPLNVTYEFILRIRTRNDVNCGAVLVVDGLRVRLLSTRDCVQLMSHDEDERHGV